jgi:hypothetical protein
MTGTANLIADIHNAMRALHQSRKLALWEQEDARRKHTCTLQSAIDAFANLNGWRGTKYHFYGLDLLGRSTMSDPLRRLGSRDCSLLDHDIWFRRDRRYIAAIGQPYLSDVDIAAARANLKARNLVLHVPPDPLASFHYPGWTLFVVVTKPGVEVRFLPEQDGRLKGLWRDWVNASPDYRAAAAAAMD